MINFLKKIENQNILIVGDVMIDAYLWGNVNRISPEAPVPIVSATKKENRLGGAANVALNLKSLGINPIICSVLGKDKDRDLFYKLMADSKLSVEGLLENRNRKTTKKTRIISSGQQLLRVDDEISYPLATEIEQNLTTRINQIINKKEITAIIFEDYDKGIISENLIQNITNLAIKNKILTAVDPKKRNYNFYKNITLFKPNFKEFIEGGKLDLLKEDTDKIFLEAKKLIKKRNIKYFFITLSEQGVFICDKDNYHLISAEFRQIADVSGAGDTVISVATLLLSQKKDKKTIASISNTAGGIVCERVGVAPILKDDLYKINLE